MQQPVCLLRRRRRLRSIGWLAVACGRVQADGLLRRFGAELPYGSVMKWQPGRTGLR
jgi:hypothetical protein